MVANLLRLAVVLSLTVATGCAPTGLQANAGPQANAGQAATLDCSSTEAYVKSAVQMMKPLNENEKKQLNAALLKESMTAIQAAAKEHNREKMKPHMFIKHLHGKTAKEILALANGPNSSPPPPPPPAVP
jgi:Family of unknown function (DUF6694)